MASDSQFEYNFLGKSGIKVSNICLGAANFGDQNFGPMWKNFTPRPRSDDETAVRMLDRFVEMGGNFIDTADMYSSGQSEQLIGRWLQGKDRHDVVLTTKLASKRDDVNPNQHGLSRKHIAYSIDKSLKHLQTDFVDMYMMHYYDTSTPIEEILRTLNDLVRCGKVRYLGVSNVMGHQLQKITDYSKFMGLEPAITVQAEYSLLVRSLEYEVFHVCKTEGISLTPWGALRGGWLTGKYKRYEAAPTGSRVEWSTANNVRYSSGPTKAVYENDEKCWQILDTLDMVAKETGKTPGQVAIRWCLQKDIVPSVVLGARTVEQLEQNVVAAKGWSLSPDQMALLDDVSADALPPTYATARNSYHSERARTQWK